ncbi:MAG TPA: glycoside hydrolase family 3 C-terminal domain-containing protein, partial [Roseiflexaceae bacterium]|nr:glycoside hydrolase family 3 C-terminal domain-containing protein [Roseiflexaceae bacterium]
VLEAAARDAYRANEHGAILLEEDRPTGEMQWFALPAGVPPGFHATLHYTLTITEDATYEFSLISSGPSRLWIDGEEQIDNWSNWQAGSAFFGFGNDEARTAVYLAAGEHQVRVAYQPAASGMLGGSVRIGFRKPLPATSVAEAAAVAARADYAIVCVGTNGEWETEGADRWGLALPGRQDELVQAVARANPNTIVLLQTGGPILMPWLAEVPVVLQAWFPGQEAGHAIADVLLGHADPGGRLPQTFPARLEDDPVHPEQPDRQYPGTDGHVEYREGLYIGYRHVDQAGLTPLFPFGFGLSYTSFELGAPRISHPTLQPGDTCSVTIPVRNSGTRPGQTVIQLYVHDAAARLERPAKELKAFAKVTLQPGAAQDVTLLLDMRSLAYFDDTRNMWVADAGDFELLIGTSSTDLPQRATIHLAAEWVQPLRSY